MPVVCRFASNRISIHIYYADHTPPHFHVRYPNGGASIAIATLEVMRGELAGRVRKQIIPWAQSHQSELQEAWERAQQGREPGNIAPP